MEEALPQGVLMEMEAFCEMIKDLELILPVLSTYRYLDDSTTYHI